MESKFVNRNFRDLTGQRFGRWTVLKLFSRGGEKPIRWLCKCNCGSVKDVPASALLRGQSKSCGCYRNEVLKTIHLIHNDKNGRLYRVWLTMNSRCRNPKVAVYPRYGGRGISVCDEWRDYRNFKKWALENGYDFNAKQGQCTIDRINNDGNYEPSNCRWVDMKVQRSNQGKKV